MARNAALFKGGPLRQLRRGIKRTGGRNNLGRVTAFHRGGGTKRLLRTIDTKRNIPGMVGTVERIEYDPFRTARAALIRWEEEAGGDVAEGKPTSASGDGKLTTRRPRELQLPRGINAVSRSELRSAVATICGVPLVEGARKRNPVTVTVDGRRKFSAMSGALNTLFFQEAQSKAFENRGSKRNEVPACSTAPEEINMGSAVALSKEFQELLKI